MGIKLRGCHQAGGLCLGLIIIYYCAPVIFHCKAAVCNCELLFVIASLRSRFVIASLRSRFVIASLRSNLSFRCPPAPDDRDRHVPRDDRGGIDRRDRFVPRDDRIACEAISLFCLSNPEQSRSLYPEGTLRCARDDRGGIDRRDRHATLAMTGAESTGEIASSLAMTKSSTRDDIKISSR